MVEGTQLPSPSDATGLVAPGQQLGKYEIIEKLATGGMAEIFLARASGMLGFQKLVVIKRILPHLASRNDFIQMFLDEARIATTLNHPNVIHTHEVGVHGKSYFIVMEYLAGEDVRSIGRRLIRDGERMPLEHALNIAIGVVAGLHYAHEKRDFDGRPLDIVHRDVTPQNVIVSYDGGVKLLDFGIAKASNRINETRSGSFKGKVPYLSPEQCRGEPLDRRTDLFSVGILLYEMTLGRRLFRGETDFQILKQIADGAVTPPRAVDPEYDEQLEAIVMRALESDPQRRFQNARELEEALEQLAHDRRLKLSPLSLADFMQRIFSDKLGEWQRVNAAGDARQLEAHFAQLAAEREADLASEEASAQSVNEPLPGLPADPEVQLATTPAPVPEAKPPARGAWLVLALVGATAAAGAGLALHAHFGKQSLPGTAPHPAVSVPVIKGAAPGGGTELPDSPSLEEPAAAAGVMQVHTVPPGATLVLDGAPLAQRSPARLEGLAAGRSHLLVVRLAGYAGMAQRFQLGPGEEASLEIDLHHAGKGVVRHKEAVGRTPAAALSPSAPAAPVVRDGEGTLVVASSPWCNVAVDGQPRGTTPVSVKLKAGEHEVVLTNAEFHIRRALSVEIEPNQVVRKKLDFAPEDR